MHGQTNKLERVSSTADTNVQRCCHGNCLYARLRPYTYAESIVSSKVSGEWVSLLYQFWFVETGYTVSLTLFR